MEEIAEGMLKVVARGILSIVRVIIWFSWEVLYERVAWMLGWPIVRLLSLNQFPKATINNEEDANDFTRAIVCIIGISYPIALAYYLARFVGG